MLPPRRAFRREIGQTPAAYVESLRVERARMLREDGAESLEVVARTTGFRSAEVLRRAFHRHVGVSRRAIASVSTAAPDPAPARATGPGSE